MEQVVATVSDLEEVVEVVKRNSKTMWVKLQDGNTIKRRNFQIRKVTPEDLKSKDEPPTMIESTEGNIPLLSVSGTITKE